MTSLNLKVTPAKKLFFTIKYTAWNGAVSGVILVSIFMHSDTFHTVSVINSFFFLFGEKSNLLLSRDLDFCVFVKSTDFKICGVIISIAT